MMVSICLRLYWNGSSSTPTKRVALSFLAEQVRTEKTARITTSQMAVIIALDGATVQWDAIWSEPSPSVGIALFFWVQPLLGGVPKE
jgi:hypothetical protein